MPVAAGTKVLTVSELNGGIRDLLEGTFPDVWVEGEVSDPRTYPSGHTYLTLKDADSQISAVLFRGAAQGLRFKLEQGLVVLARGRVSAYLKRGQYQLILTELEPRTMGALQLAFEQLKARLQAEGLFDPARKRPIPVLPQRIGIVTSLEGAAIRDMLAILRRRFENLEIVIHPVRVQGEEAKSEIAEAIETLNAGFPELEVLLVGRGGGSLEDLWAFNEEIVARAIAASRIPVISCVGHETDVTIADFTADLRAPTPSAAAELVVKNKEEVVRHLDSLGVRLSRSVAHRVANLETHLAHLVEGRLAPVLKRRVERLEERFRHAVASVPFRFPLRLAQDRGQELDELARRLVASAGIVLERSRAEVARRVEKLHALSPLAVLARGYSIAFLLPARKVLKDASQVREGDRFELKLSRGSLEAQVFRPPEGGRKGC